MVLHAVTVAGLRDGLGAPLLVAKVLADLTLLGAALPVLLRRFVFPPRLAPAAS
jgi:hypothetical protein